MRKNFQLLDFQLARLERVTIDERKVIQKSNSPRIRSGSRVG